MPDPKPTCDRCLCMFSAVALTAVTAPYFLSKACGSAILKRSCLESLAQWCLSCVAVLPANAHASWR